MRKIKELSETYLQKILSSFEKFVSIPILLVSLFGACYEIFQPGELRFIKMTSSFKYFPFEELPLPIFYIFTGSVLTLLLIYAGEIIRALIKLLYVYVANKESDANMRKAVLSSLKGNK